jgi:hypothetical protein
MFIKMTVTLSVARFLLHNALERDDLCDLVTGYIAVIAIVVLHQTGCAYDPDTQEITIGMEFSAGDFVKKIVDFSNMDQISVALRDSDYIQRLVCPHFTDHPMKPGMEGYELTLQPFPPPKGKSDVLSYLINQVPKSHPRMLVMACFYEANMKTVQEHFKQKIKAISHIPTRWSMDPPSDPYEKSTWRWRAFYRSKEWRVSRRSHRALQW